MLEIAGTFGIVTNVLIILLLAAIVVLLWRGPSLGYRRGAGTDGLREQTRKNIELLSTPENALREYVISELLLYQHVDDIAKSLRQLTDDQEEEYLKKFQQDLRPGIKALFHKLQENGPQIASTLLQKVNGILAKYAGGALGGSKQ